MVGEYLGEKEIEPHEGVVGDHPVVQPGEEVSLELDDLLPLHEAVLDLRIQGRRVYFLVLAGHEDARQSQRVDVALVEVQRERQIQQLHRQEQRLVVELELVAPLHDRVDLQPIANPHP